MKKQQLKVVALATFLSAGVLFGNASNAAEVKDILAVGSQKTAAAKKSQQKIDRLQEKTVDLNQQFKRVNKQIEDLKVYNQQLENQIKRQREVLTQLDESIAQATEMERQVPPSDPEND